MLSSLGALMIIECPYCSTRFRLHARRLSDTRSMLKCSECQRVFVCPGRRPAPSPQEVPPEDEGLFMPLDDDEWHDEPGADTGVSEEQFTLNEPLASGGRSGQTTAAVEPRRPVSAPRSGLDEDDDGGREADEADEDDSETAGMSLRPVFVFLLLVVGGYTALTWTLLENRRWTERVTRNLPVIGSDTSLPDLHGDVALIGLQARYEHTKEGKLVFLITGKAVNRSARPLSNVRVSLKLFDGTDRQIDEQITPCGNPIQVDLVRELSVHQVAILKGMKPPPDFGIQPGEHCPFVGIFLDVPGTVAAFSVELVGAQRHV